MLMLQRCNIKHKRVSKQHLTVAQWGTDAFTHPKRERARDEIEVRGFASDEDLQEAREARQGTLACHSCFADFSVSHTQRISHKSIERLSSFSIFPFWAITTPIPVWPFGPELPEKLRVPTALRDILRLASHLIVLLGLGPS
ncbi:hypothetical protein DTO271D3_5280 [Paecilomyces variotii]|nr:hypothetical protein DTO271D3_5280 [Paecilomyces variotii]